MAVPFVVTPVLPTFRARHPRIEVEVAVEDRFVEIVADGYDAGVRLSEAIERDMVQVRLTDAGRFAVVGAPAYLDRHGTPQRPEWRRSRVSAAKRSRTTRVLDGAWARLLRPPRRSRGARLGSPAQGRRSQCVPPGLRRQHEASQRLACAGNPTQLARPMIEGPRFPTIVSTGEHALRRRTARSWRSEPS